MMRWYGRHSLDLGVLRATRSPEAGVRRGQAGGTAQPAHVDARRGGGAATRPPRPDGRDPRSRGPRPHPRRADLPDARAMGHERERARAAPRPARRSRLCPHRRGARPRPRRLDDRGAARPIGRLAAASAADGRVRDHRADPGRPRRRLRRTHHQYRPRGLVLGPRAQRRRRLARRCGGLRGRAGARPTDRRRGARPLRRCGTARPLPRHRRRIAPGARAGAGADPARPARGLHHRRVEADSRARHQFLLGVQLRATVRRGAGARARRRDRHHRRLGHQRVPRARGPRRDRRALSLRHPRRRRRPARPARRHAGIRPRLQPVGERAGAAPVRVLAHLSRLRADPRARRDLAGPVVRRAPFAPRRPARRGCAARRLGRSFCAREGGEGRRRDRHARPHLQSDDAAIEGPAGHAARDQRPDRAAAPAVRLRAVLRHSGSTPTGGWTS